MKFMPEKPKYAVRRCLLSAAEAKAEAQKIAFGPIVFQAVSAMKELGLFDLLWNARDAGLTIEEAAERSGLTVYAVTVLFESAMSSAVLDVKEERFYLSKVGYFLHRDELTEVNFAFVRDVCYTPASRLAESLREGRPVGLEELETKHSEASAGLAPTTVYESLLSLSKPTLKSWLAFDHFYSDRSFDEALDVIAAEGPRRLMDVGANTGRFAAACLSRMPELQVTLVDHPAQLDRAGTQLTESGFAGRFHLEARDLLDEELAFPGGMDGVWLSQLLDCFSESQVRRLLASVRTSLNDGGLVYILEPCWDLQPQESGAFCLLQTSLYFSCVANGTSRMYDSVTLERLIAESGLRVERRHDGLGVGHGLFACRAQ